MFLLIVFIVTPKRAYHHFPILIKIVILMPKNYHRCGMYFFKVAMSEYFISLHIRSTWETICDAWACWSGWNFGPNSDRIPPILKFRITPSPKNENCQRVQIREFQNTPQWKLSESPNPRVSEYPTPKWKLSESPNLRVSEYPPPQWKLSESPNPRVSEYPPNENCQRVQIWEIQNTLPPKKNWKNFRF